MCNEIQNKMKVFIVIRYYDYHFEDWVESFFGVYETHEKAEKAIKTYIEKGKARSNVFSTTFKNFSIKEHEVL